MIEGDNLEVLKLLQKSYAGKVKLIYIDPPYNTGNNLIYPNDYRDGIRTYLEVTGQAREKEKQTSNPASSGHFHTNWLSMIYPRLKLARSFLAKDGMLICTIDDNELAQLGTILREIFEEETYKHVCVPIIHNPRGVQGKNFSYVHEYGYFVYPSGIKAIGEIVGKTVHSVGGGTLIACLDERIASEDAEPLASGIADWHAQAKHEGEATVIFRDSAFADDIAKTNTAAILNQRGLKNVRSL